MSLGHVSRQDTFVAIQELDFQMEISAAFSVHRLQRHLIGSFHVSDFFYTGGGGHESRNQEIQKSKCPTFLIMSVCVCVCGGGGVIRKMPVYHS